MLNPREKNQDAKLVVKELEKMRLEDRIIIVSSINALRQKQVLDEEKKRKEQAM
ncbi:MAG: hypothetical protein RR335_10610 [Eubacterium sp.]